MTDQTAAATHLPIESFRRASGRGGSDLVYGLVSQVLQMGSGLLLLPVVVATLTSAEIGFWYVFMSIQSLVYLIDFGFIPTFSRNFNYVFAGANAIRSDGLAPPTETGHVSIGLLRGLLKTSRNIYRLMAIVVGAFLATAGSLYLARLVGDTPGVPNIWFDWWVFCAALTGHTYFQWQIAVLNGADRIRETYVVAIVSRGVQIVLSVIGLALHPSLTTLVVVYALSALVMRLHLFLCMRDILLTTKKAVGSALPQSDLFPLLWSNTWRYGLVLISSFLIARFNVLLIAWFFGVETSGTFAIASQALIAITAVSHVLSTMAFPKIIGSKVTGDFERAKTLLSAALVFMWASFVAGAVALIVLGPYLLSLVKEGARLPMASVLVLMAIATFIESNLQLLTTAITADNKIPFMRAYILSGILIAVGCMLAGSAGLGFQSFLAIQIIVQCTFNAWRWPMMAFRDLGLRLAEVPRLAVSGLRTLIIGH